MDDLATFIATVPKVELHLHLEGSVDAALARTLAERRGVTVPRLPPPGQGFSDFDQFLGCYIAISKCFEQPEDFRDAVDDLARRLAAQNVRYAEVTFTTMTHESRGVPRDVILQGLSEGRAAAATRGVTLCWVYDVVRIFPEQAAPTLESALAMQALDPRSVVGFGVGGPERDHDDPRALADVFAAAKQAGLHSVPHAGEQAGPGSIWGALEVLGAERIGHGVRCVEDPKLVEHLVNEQIPLEVCPTSNVNLGVVPSLEQHMLPTLLAAGVELSIASDDPPLFGTDLTTELLRVATTFGLDVEGVRALCANAIRHSFLPADRKAELDAELAAVEL